MSLIGFKANDKEAGGLQFNLGVGVGVTEGASIPISTGEFSWPPY